MVATAGEAATGATSKEAGARFKDTGETHEEEAEVAGETTGVAQLAMQVCNTLIIHAFLASAYSPSVGNTYGRIHPACTESITAPLNCRSTSRNCVCVEFAH